MAYGRTFLAVVNDVLRELREEEVTSWNQTTYSTLVGGWVNSCKRDAEAAWQWRALRREETVPANAGTSVYSFGGSDERLRVLDAWNTTKGIQLRQRTWQSFNELNNSLVALPSGDVSSWGPYGLNGTTGAYQIRVYKTPDAAQTLTFTVYRPQDDLAANDTAMLVPFRPVVEGAVARARYERGDDGGVSYGDQQRFMNVALADFIAQDSGQSEQDIVWAAV